MEEILNRLSYKISTERLKLNEPMSKHTSFKIGGPADIFVVVDNLEELKFVLEEANRNNIPVTCIGNGTNLLVKDKGIRGITVKLKFKEVRINGDIVEAGSGVPLPVLARKAYENRSIRVRICKRNSRNCWWSN